MKQKSYCYYRSLLLLLMSVLLVSAMSGCGGDSGSTAGGGASPGLVFFDDFAYSGNTDMELTDFGWHIRGVDESGKPGYDGALWLKENVNFTTESGNTVLQLSAAVSGSAVSQSEISTTDTFYEGTYAARVKFSDEPVTGTGGNYICETFFTITQGKYGSADYSECDFEYLPNGGWDGENPDTNVKRQRMYFTTWETDSDNSNLSDSTKSTFSGWHLLTMTVMNGTVTYFIDGHERFSHSGIYYPESPMVIDFNLWFLDQKLNLDLVDSKYQQQVDWVYYCKDKAITTAEVERHVTELRNQSVKRLNQFLKK